MRRLVDIPFHIHTAIDRYPYWHDWPVPRRAARAAGLFIRQPCVGVGFVVSDEEVFTAGSYIGLRWRCSIGRVNGERVAALCRRHGAQDIAMRFYIDVALPDTDGVPADQALTDEWFIEGGVVRVQVDRHERCPEARRLCIVHYGPICQACGFDFEKVYGLRGAGFIHVHHLTPMAKQTAQYRVDPVRDLRPVCPNCHAMIHTSTPMLTIEGLKNLIEKQGRLSLQPSQI